MMENCLCKEVINSYNGNESHQDFKKVLDKWGRNWSTNGPIPRQPEGYRWWWCNTVMLSLIFAMCYFLQAQTWCAT